MRSVGRCHYDNDDCRRENVDEICCQLASIDRTQLLLVSVIVAMAVWMPISTAEAPAASLSSKGL
jgi:hypothetical protein